MEKQGRRFADEKTKEVKVKKVKEKEVAPLPSEPSEKEQIRDEKKIEKHKQKDQRLKEKNAKKLEKLMQKQRKREEKSNRPVLSYEDLPVDEVEPSREPAPIKIKITKKRIFAAVLIVVFLFLVVFFIANPERLSIESISNFINYGILNRNSDEHFPLDISGESISPGGFLGKGMNVCYSSDTKTQEINSYGKIVSSTPHAFINPVLVTGKKNMLVYNLGGTGYQVIDSDKNVRTLEAKDKIMLADITDSGIYALVTQHGGYLSKLYVYDEKDNQIFAYSFSEYYVTAVTLSDSGRHAVVSGVSAADGLDVTAIYVLDFTKDTPLYLLKYEENIIYDVQYLNEKYVCAVGRSASYVVNSYNGSVEATDYQGKTLTAYDINRDTDTYTLSLSNSGDGRNCDIISYNSSGKQDKSFHVDDKIIDVSTYKGRVALLTGDSVLLYGKDGGFISKNELRSDPHTVVLYTGSDAYVLCTGYIETMSL